MRRAAAVVGIVALLVAGCGSGGDVEQLQQRVDDLERQVAIQRQEIDKLRSETAAVRSVQRRLDDIQGVVDGIKNGLGALIP